MPRAGEPGVALYFPHINCQHDEVVYNALKKAMRLNARARHRGVVQISIGTMEINVLNETKTLSGIAKFVDDGLIESAQKSHEQLEDRLRKKASKRLRRNEALLQQQLKDGLENLSGMLQETLRSSLAEIVQKGLEKKEEADQAKKEKENKEEE